MAVSPTTIRRAALCANESVEGCGNLTKCKIVKDACGRLNLKAAHPYFDFKISALIGWRRYGGSCVYCHRNLMTDWETLLGCATDHLLPRTYEDILWNDWNLVLGCAVCNTLKREYDCNPELPPDLRYNGGPDLSEEQHSAILKLCRKEVSRRRKTKQRWLDGALTYWNGLELTRQAELTERPPAGF